MTTQINRELTTENREHTRRLAVFDIDGTIFRSSLTIESVNAFVDAGIFPRRAVEEVEDDLHAWMNRQGSYKNYARKIIKTHVKYIRGAKESDVRSAIRHMIKVHKDHVYIFTRDIIKKLKKENYFLLTISGSPTYVVAPFATYLGFDQLFGTVYGVKRGVFTGEALSVDAALDKGKVLNEFLADSKQKFDLEKSIAVGDTESDIPLLEAVGRPIAFNPNQELAEVARKRSWQLIVERKDVVYDIKKFEIVKG